jgi:hypothetical protein
MSDTDQEKLKEKLLAQVPIDGTSVGNTALRAALGWELGQYQTIRDELVRDGLIEPWRGRGGTVRRTRISEPPKPAPLKAAEVEKEEKEVSKRRILETKLYPPLLSCLKLWAKDQGWTDHVVHQLAHQGRRNTGGVWTRPDFVVIGYRKFEYTPGIVRDLETFEVKTSTCGIDAVFETAAHSRVATKSYLVIHRTNEGPATEDLDRIESECVRFGLGLILFADPKNYETWEYRVEPRRQEPDPFDVEEFVQTQVPSTDQERIRKWLR